MKRQRTDHQKPMKSFKDTIQINVNFLEEIFLTPVCLGKIRKTTETREIKTTHQKEMRASFLPFMHLSLHSVNGVQATIR